MYLNFKVKIPSDSPGISRKKIKGITYIYYAYEHTGELKVLKYDVNFGMYAKQAHFINVFE